MKNKISRLIVCVSIFTVIYTIIGAVYLLLNTENFLRPLVTTTNINTLLGLTLSYVVLTIGSFLFIGIISGTIFYYLTRR